MKWPALLSPQGRAGKGLSPADAPQAPESRYGASATIASHRFAMVGLGGGTVDAADLKSAAPRGAWGFESLPGHALSKCAVTYYRDGTSTEGERPADHGGGTGLLPRAGPPGAGGGGGGAAG